MIKNAVLTAALVLGAVAALPASAAVTPTQSTFSFSGTCSDCDGVGTADLVLTGYTVGQSIDPSNFLSFTYYGTNLLPSFTITASQLSFIGGSIDAPLPGPEDVFLAGNDQIFGSQLDGRWCVGVSCLADFGVQHAWSGADATSVPEPLTAALLGAPLLAAVTFRRR